MKTIQITLIYILLFPVSIHALVQQNDPPDQLGSISFIQGDVQIFKESDWDRIRLNQSVTPQSNIRTGPAAQAEITWNTGEATLVGSNEHHNIGELFEAFQKSEARLSEGVFSRFRQMFRASTEERRQAEGGIRRDMVEIETKPSPDDLYWYVDEQVDIYQIFEVYDENEYREALRLLLLYRDQQPRSPYLPQVLFMTGHCYTELNNIPQAQAIFNRLTALFPDHELAEDTRDVLSKL